MCFGKKIPGGISVSFALMDGEEKRELGSDSQGRGILTKKFLSRNMLKVIFL